MLGPDPRPMERTPSSGIERLDSWKEIASYLKRSLRTVQRWEKQEGLPVHRHTHDKLGSVYAYPAELDEWWRDRRPRLEPIEAPEVITPRRPSVRWLWIAAVLGGVAAIAVGVGPWQREPFAKVTVSRLTSTGIASRAAISADGKFLAYVLGDLGQHSIYIRDLESSRDGQLLPPTRSVFGGLSFSEDGRFLFYNKTSADHNAAALYRIPVFGGQPHKLKEGLKSPASISPDGSRIAFVREDQEHHQSVLVIAELNGSVERSIAMREYPSFLDYPSWSPDGGKIAFVSVGPKTAFVQIREVDVTTAAERPIAERTWSYAKQVKWLNNRTGLVFSARERPGEPFSLWYVGYPSGEPRKIIHELDDFGAVSITADSTRIVTVQDKLVSSLWLAPTSDLGHAKQLAFDSSRFSQASLGPDGSIFLEKQQGDRRNIWAIAPDGSNQKQLTFDGNNYEPAACPAGPYVVYTCERDGLKGICRIKRDGSTIEQIVPSTAINVATRCSPNGEFVVYSAWGDGKWPTAWKVPVEDGAPNQLTDKLCFRPAVSPDNASIACFYSEQPSAQADPDSIAVIPVAGGAPSKLFPLPSTAYTPSGLRWTPDGSGIAYVDNQGGASNIRVQPLEGKPRQLTDFRGDRIFYFEWSPDGRQLAFSRGTRSYDVFLIQDLR